MSRGTLRIYLGAAPGVGKTFAMLAEARRRAQRGTDVVVGIVDTRGRPRTAEQLVGLEVLPPRRVLDHTGQLVAELDVEAVIDRAPKVVLVDDLAATNIAIGSSSPSSSHAKRWQEVEVLLSVGIDVVSTLNVQNLESLGDLVERIVGVAESDTVPDEFVRQAEQIELVDMTPEALRRRLAHGNVYPADRIDATVTNLFRPGTLSALRELALLWVADRVEESLLAYLDAHDIADTWETRERVVVAVTGAPGNDAVIRRAARIARRSHGELVGVHVTSVSGLVESLDRQLGDNRQLLVRLGGRYHEVIGDDIARALAGFAQAERATQLVIGRSHRSRWHELRRGSVVNTIARELRGVDVHVIATQPGAPDHGLPSSARKPLPRRRLIVAWFVALVGLPLVTIVGVSVRDHVGQSAPLMAYLLLVAAVAALGGALPGMVSAAGGFVLANWFFTPPLHQWTVAESEDVVALVAYVSVAAIVATLVGANARRTAEASRVRAEAEALARTTGALVGENDPLPSLLVLLRSTFSLDSATILRRADDGWQIEATVGDTSPASPDDGEAIDLDAHAVLVLVGGPLSAEDRRLLRSFAAQLGAALASRRLQAEASQATLLAAANNLRSAMLQSVSHDLRTPLASIKASVTSLLQPDVRFSRDEENGLLETIDEEADRLNRVIGNLLDMSRLQAGVLRPACIPVEVEDVLAGALDMLGQAAHRVHVEVDPGLPALLADPGLLERVLANLLANALAWAPPDDNVRFAAVRTGASIAVRISDRGPGIPIELRSRVFDPFQRLGDRSSQAGVGLGLAVARGFVAAMGGGLELDDTPGGGLTAIVTLPAVAE